MSTTNDLINELLQVDDEDLVAAVNSLTDQEVTLLTQTTATPTKHAHPLLLARRLNDNVVKRRHLSYLSRRVAEAVKDVENGKDRRIIVSMPPGSGKSYLGSIYTPLWVLSKHPDWKIVLASHSPTLATSWGRQIRRIVEEKGPELGITIAPDAKAVAEWETTAGGRVVSRGTKGKITGERAHFLLVDDPVADWATAHSVIEREKLWEWWKGDAYGRLAPTSLVVVIATRWHEDDLTGRLLSPEYEGNPDDWEQIVFPAIAKDSDVLGREPGQPLLSPMDLHDTPEKAIKRFETIKRNVGTLAWSSLYEQSPSPAKGMIFDTDWWRYWTSNPSKATDDDKVMFFDTDLLETAQVITTWDATFKGTDSSDYVVGQRWARIGADFFLLDQVRKRMSFTETLNAMRNFAINGLGASQAREHLVEDKANGPAIMDVLKKEIPGMKPVLPKGSKEARAHSVTPAIESGNVYIPHPSEESWVKELLNETRSFPNGEHDDMVDALTQALNHLHRSKAATIHSPTKPRKTLPNSHRVAW